MFDLVSIIKTAGYLGLLGIVFSESGLLIGVFLPGDSLLFTAGFLASQGFLSILILAPLCFLSALAGDNTGYWFGKKIGPKIFTREDSLLFHKKHLERAHAVYARHGAKIILFARFMPIVRTFAPLLAGVGAMPYRMFLLYDVMGTFIWSFGLLGLGYWLGSAIPNVDRYLLPIIAGIIFLSFLPSMIHVLRNKEDRALIASKWHFLVLKIFKNKV